MAKTGCSLLQVSLLEPIGRTWGLHIVNFYKGPNIMMPIFGTCHWTGMIFRLLLRQILACILQQHGNWFTTRSFAITTPEAEPSFH